MVMGDTKRACVSRRQKLEDLLGDQGPAVVPAGGYRTRNLPDNPYPFRASSHFLYYVGMHLPRALLWVAPGETCVYRPAPSEEFDEWALFQDRETHEAELEDLTGVRVLTFDEFGDVVKGTAPACLPLLELADRNEVAHRLGRDPTTLGRSDVDARLVDAVVQQRLCNDEAALDEVRASTAVSIEAQRAAMAGTAVGDLEWVPTGAVHGAVAARGYQLAYPPTVTTRGDILHDPRHHRTLHHGDLLLCDVGAEGSTGWVGETTRTWPISGTFSDVQRALYDLVVAAQAEAMSKMRPTVAFTEVHLAACRVLTQGLVDEGILSGNVDGLIERGVHAIFFPHSTGHLVGLDVHDMADLGDAAGHGRGYAPSEQFGLNRLRLTRPLAENMVVSVDPGLYFIRELVREPHRLGLTKDDFNEERVKRYFKGTNAIRLGDPVQITDSGCRLLSEELPRAATEIEALLRELRA